MDKLKKLKIKKEEIKKNMEQTLKDYYTNIQKENSILKEAIRNLEILHIYNGEWQSATYDYAEQIKTLKNMIGGDRRSDE